MTKKHKKKTTHRKTKKQKEEELIEDGLKVIYGDEKVNFSTLDRKRNRLTNFLITVIISLGLFAGIGWGGFLLYNKYALSPIEETFVLEIEASDELISGEPTEIIINYRNPNSVPITALELDVRIPETFIITNLSPTPSNLEEHIWSIGNLSAGSDGVIIIEGIWIAETPSSTPIQVLANYRPTNFNSDFQDIETIYISTIDSTFDLSFSGPQEAIPGEIVEYTVKIKNESKEAILNTIVDLELPEGFFLEESTPSIESGSPSIWEYASFESEEEKEIIFSGTFAADIEGFQYFNTEVRVKSNNRELVQIAKEDFTSVLSSDLSLNLIADGTTDQVNAAPGDNIRITFTYENSGDTDIEGVDLLLDFISDQKIPVNWNEADLDGGTITAAGIVWNDRKTTILQPGDRELINLIIPITDTVTAQQADAFSVVASATQNEITIKSTPLNVAINSEANLQASIRYFNDDGTPLGNGPIPPEVDEETTYRVFWTVKNSLHDLEGVSISATLPPNVVWEAQSEAQLGTISHNPANDSVTWELSSIPTTVERLQANFTISITPESEDVNQFVILLSESLLSATDSITQDVLQSRSDQLTTELLGDEFAEGKGIVVE